MDVGNVPIRERKRMKPEPLKGKGREFKDLETYDIVLNTVLFRKHEIKSAVEWLKEQINIKKAGEAETIIIMNVLSKIDEAFEDVVKS